MNRTLEKFISRLLLLAVIVGLTGCGFLPEQEDKTQNWSASKLYTEAKKHLNDSEYEEAIKLYERLAARYPFGAYAQQATLEQAYAYYKQDESDSALATLDYFLKTYPDHRQVSYAYYLRGLVNFNRGIGLIERYLPIDPAKRDPGRAQESYHDFYLVYTRYPDSSYAPDARLRIIYLRNLLAQYELNIANYYMERKAYMAAARRASTVLEHYPQATATPDALILISRAYHELKLTELEQDALRILKKNYPDRALNN